MIIGATPVVIAVVSALFGRERLHWQHWAGALISVTGIYYVVGHGAAFAGSTIAGDVLVMISVACWVAYTLGAGRLMSCRHRVSGMYTMPRKGTVFTTKWIPRGT